MHDNKLIPVFPLPIVVFPNEELRLHIFEERYKELIQDCKKNDIVFCILPVIEQRLMKTGTILRLKSIVKEYQDGKMDILLKAEAVCYCNEFIEQFPGKLYSGIYASLIEIKYDLAIQQKISLQEKFEELCSINNVQPYHPIDWDNFSSYHLGHFVGFNLQEEYQFFGMSSESERNEILHKQLDKMIQQSDSRKKWISKMSLNGEFRSLSS